MAVKVVECRQDSREAREALNEAVLTEGLDCPHLVKVWCAGAVLLHAVSCRCIRCGKDRSPRPHTPPQQQLLVLTSPGVPAGVCADPEARAAVRFTGPRVHLLAGAAAVHTRHPHSSRWG